MEWVTYRDPEMRVWGTSGRSKRSQRHVLVGGGATRGRHEPAVRLTADSNA